MEGTMADPRRERETDKGVGAETERRDGDVRQVERPATGSGRESTRDTGVGDTVADDSREPRQSER
jgi:hypothetical protein